MAPYSPSYRVPSAVSSAIVTVIGTLPWLLTMPITFVMPCEST